MAKKTLVEKPIIKSTSKVEKPKATKTPKKTISSLVLSEFKNNPTISSKEMQEKVLKLVPESKFNVYHFSWYRYQIKKGRYTKQFSKEQIAKLFPNKESK